MKDPVSGRLVFDLTQANTDGAVIIEVIQNAGEVIFVPSGWHHQVYNLVWKDADHVIQFKIINNFFPMFI